MTILNPILIEHAYEDMQQITRDIVLEYELDYHEFIPEEFDNLHKYLVSQQIIHIDDEDKKKFLILVNEHEIDQRPKFVSDDPSITNRPFTTYEKFEDIPTHVLPRYHGATGRIMMSHEYKYYMETHSQDDFPVNVIGIEFAKNIPDFLKKYISTDVNLVDYDFKPIQKIRYGQIKDKRYYIISNAKEGNPLKECTALALNIPYECYSKCAYLPHVVYLYDLIAKKHIFGGGQIITEDFERMFTTAAEHGIEYPIYFQIVHGSLLIRYGFRNLLMALHCKLPSIPAIVMASPYFEGWTQTIIYKDLGDKKMINELCEPYIQIV